MRSANIATWRARRELTTGPMAETKQYYVPAASSTGSFRLAAASTAVSLSSSYPAGKEAFRLLFHCQFDTAPEGGYSHHRTNQVFDSATPRLGIAHRRDPEGKNRCRKLKLDT